MDEIFLYPCNICKSKQRYLICIDCINKYFKKPFYSNSQSNSNSQLNSKK